MQLTKQRQIEYLCENEIEDYGRAVSGTSPFGRMLDDQAVAQILTRAAVFKYELEAKTVAEIDAMFKRVKDQEWQDEHLTLEAAVQTIANKLFPEDPYAWTPGQRAECADAYREHLKAQVLNGWIAFINPHTKLKFEHARLSQQNFPDDGLIQVSNLYRCLMPADANKGHFPQPPKPVSKAPAPITPIRQSAPPSSRPAPPPTERRLPASSVKVSLARRPVKTEIWHAKDLWAEDELVCFMCGFNPSTRLHELPYWLSAAAREAIHRAMAARSTAHNVGSSTA